MGLEPYCEAKIPSFNCWGVLLASENLKFHSNFMCNFFCYSICDGSWLCCCDIEVIFTILAGEKGLFSLAPPHQGIDGEWSDRSGVIVYKWNEKSNRPNTGIANWKKRWSCCAEYDENAPPCRRGWHVSYDDGFTLY